MVLSTVCSGFRDRIDPAARVAGLVVLCAVVLDLLLSLSLGLSPRALAREEMVDPDGLQLLAARIEAVSRQREGGSAALPKLAVAVGLSTGREDIAPKLFEQQTGGRYRMLNLAASGGSVSEMRAYAEPLLTSRLRPDLVVVAMHPSWLAGRELRASLPPLPEWGAAGLTWPALQNYAGAWRQCLAQRSWLLANRTAMHTKMRRGLLALRMRLDKWLGMPLQDLVPGTLVGDPWEVRSLYTDAYAPADFLAMQLREWGAAGWFDAERLGPSDEARGLREWLPAVQALSPHVVMVLMPEAEEFRSNVPEQGQRTLRSMAADAQPPIPVLDLRASMPASAFRDQAHLNAYGRRQFTVLLAEHLMALQAQLPASR